jgi:hypothetical protein
LIGLVKDATGSTSTGLLALAVLPLIGGLLVFFGGHESTAGFAGQGGAKWPLSPRRKPGPIRRGPSLRASPGDVLLKQLFVVVMGPGLRRDDEGFELRQHVLTLTK